MTASRKFSDENPEKAKAALPDYTSLDRGLIEKIPDLTALLPSK